MPYTHHPAPGHELTWREQGDYLQFYYLLWLFNETILGRASWFRDPYQFAVPGVTQTVWTYFFPLSPVFFVFSPLGGPFAYNALVLLSFPASGIIMALLARRLGVGWLAAAAAGAVFALFPHRLAVLLGGQPIGFGFFLFPLVFLFGEIALERRSLGIGLLAGLAILCLPTVDPHLLFFLGLVAPFYLWLRLPAWVSPARPARVEPSRGSISLAVLWAIAIGLGFLLGLAAEMFPGAPKDGPLFGRLALWLAGWLLLWCALSESLTLLGGEGWAVAQARALVVLSPLAGAFLFRGVGSVIAVPRFGLMLGVIGIVGSGALYLRALTSRGVRILFRQLAPLLPAFGLTILAAGYMVYVKKTVLDVSLIGSGRSLDEIRLFAPTFADLITRNQPHAASAIYPGVVASLIAATGLVAGRARRRSFLLGLLFAAALFLSLGPTVSALPFYNLFYRFVPFGAFIRQTAKFQLLAAFALALLVALGVSRLGAVRRFGVGLAALALALLVADYLPLRSVGLSLLPRENAVYRYLETAKDTGPLLYLPLWPGESSWSSVYQYAATLTRIPMVNGYAPAVPLRYVREVARPLEPVNWGELDEPRLADLRRLGVRFLVLDREAFPPKVSSFPSALTFARLLAAPALTLVASDHPLSLFRLGDGGPGRGMAPTSPQGVYLEAARLPRRVGRVVRAAGGDSAAVVADPSVDPPGYLVFGPYRPFPTGRYRAIFRLRADGPLGQEVARVDVAAERGERVLAARRVEGLGGREDDVTVEWTQSSPAFLEFRVFFRGVARVAVEYVYVTFADQRDPPELLEIEDLMHSLPIVEDPLAKNGRAAWVRQGWTPRDELLTGPFRRVPPGHFVARFRIRTGTPTSSLRLAVKTAGEGQVLREVEVSGAELPRGAYGEIALPFSLVAPRVLELSVRYLGGGDLWLDRVEIRPSGG